MKLTGEIKKVVAVSDHNTCECCGKTNLKRTLIIKDENGNHVYYGVDCARKELGKDKKVIAKEVQETFMTLIIDQNMGEVAAIEKMGLKLEDIKIISHMISYKTQQSLNTVLVA